MWRTACVVVLALAGAAWADAPAQHGRAVGNAVEQGEREASDDWITAKIREQFLVDSLVKGRHIDVSTKDHRVELKGWVQSSDEHQRALSIARNTKGVDSVEDRLIVSP